MKLFVAQIRRLTLCGGIEDSHCLHGHPITRAEVVGTVVSVVAKAKMGTGALGACVGVCGVCLVSPPRVAPQTS